MGKSKKDKKDSKEKSSKRSSKDKKKRRRDDTSDSTSECSSSDSEREPKRKAARPEKLAAKVAAHLQRGGADEAPRFVWTKKIEKELESGKSVKDIAASQSRYSQAERMEEIEKVRKRQADREAEKAAREEELTMIQRLRAAQEAMESEAKEEEFYLKALINKAQRRFGEGRPAPLDLVAKNLHMAEQYDCDMHPPWSYFDGLMLEEAEQLYQGICEYQEYDKYDDLHAQFWKALRVVADAEIAEARKRDAADRAALRRGPSAAASAAAGALGAEDAEAERRLHSDVELQIETMLQGQTLSSLRTMERDVEAALAGSMGDPEYWEAVLTRLQVHKAKAEVREVQAAIMQRHISAQLTAREAAKAAAAAEGGVPAEGSSESEGEDEDEEEEEGGEAGARPQARATPMEGEDGEGPGPAPRGDGGADDDEAVPAAPLYAPGAAPLPDDDAGPGAAGTAGADDANDGCLSPAPIPPEDAAGLEVVHEEEDYREIQLLRQQVKLQASNAFKAAAALASVPGTNNQMAAERAYQALLARGMSATHPAMRNLPLPGPEGEEDTAAMATFRNVAERAMGQDANDRAFGGEVALESKVYWWHEKYKPRKPKYFNRVHTGYEWNKYNQTHYDYDNPPPKVVQGYKFNIMYFDLIDKQKAPTYRVAPDPESKDGSTCLLIFSAGPPYEDIAFRIVNKEWEYSHKRGFKSTFDRGIMHLFINFKRTRYRR